MIRFEAWGIRFTLPLFTLLTPILALQLGVHGTMGALILALSVHELAHLLAARLCGVQVREICLLPFGGSTKIENPYLLPAAKLVPVAMAGPMANLLLAMLCAALAHWGWISTAQASSLILPNWTLLLFNLLPALPLDGGRTLQALLQQVADERHALQICVLSGRILACLLLLCALWNGLMHRIWNLTFIFAAIFIFSSGRDESSALSASRAIRLDALLKADTEALPVRFLQLPGNTTIADALRLIRPRMHTYFIVTSKSRFSALVSDRQLFDCIINDTAPDTPLEDLSPYLLRFGTSGAAVRSSYSV